MADEADIANDRAQADLDRALKAAAREIPPGVSGECYSCGEHSPRLIRGACARCRDKYALDG